MNKQEIIEALKANHQAFTDTILALTDADFMFSLEDKWTAGQQMDHIYLSVSPLVKVLKLPNFVLAWKFGKSNRPSKEYPVLVEKYHAKLAAGGRATSRFVPPTISIAEKEQLKNKVLKMVYSLTKQVEGYTEKQLDTYILPHPLLGMLTLREMLYFTIYHVQHHQQLALRNLNK